jgi:hypothetical protein
MIGRIFELQNRGLQILTSGAVLAQNLKNNATGGGASEKNAAYAARRS